MPNQVRVGIDLDDGRMVIALRDSRGHRATLNMARRGCPPLAATLALVASDEAGQTEAEFILHGATLETESATPHID